MPNGYEKRKPTEEEKKIYSLDINKEYWFVETSEYGFIPFFDGSKSEAAVIEAIYPEFSERFREGKNLGLMEGMSQAYKETLDKIIPALNAQTKAANITADAQTLDQNEIKAYELIKKTGLLNDLEGFNAKLIAGDKEALSDALILEQALAKDGKSLTADGKITNKTIEAAKALIGENSQAILNYEAVIEKITPKPSPVVSQETEPQKQ